LFLRILNLQMKPKEKDFALFFAYVLGFCQPPLGDSSFRPRIFYHNKARETAGCE